MKDPCAIFFGLILMIVVDGEYHQEEQATHLGKILPKILITQTALLLWLELTNLLWKVLIGVRWVLEGLAVNLFA